MKAEDGKIRARVGPLGIVPLAVTVTLTAMAMAGVAAWDRGGTLLDRTLLLALSVAICAATHLLPALSKRPAVWLLWGACLLGTMYGHLTFFTHAGMRAAELRGSQSAVAQVFDDQAGVTREALDGIKARPVTVVARELSRAKSEQRREALEAELSEARRAAALRDGLVRVAQAQGAARLDDRADPVMARLSAVTGGSEASIGVLVGVALALLLELLGAFLWCEALSGRVLPSPSEDRDSPNTERSHARAREDCPDTAHDDASVLRLRQAVESGVCRPTVASIRVFMACSQARALELRRCVVAPVA